jgi:hypothetical protein
MKKEVKTSENMAIKVILSVPERVVFATLLPTEGSIVEMTLGKALIKRINLNEEEIKEYECVRLPDGRQTYNKLKAKLREFRFETFEILFIQQGARSLDRQKRLTPFNYELAERFLAIAVKTKEESK